MTNYFHSPTYIARRKKLVESMEEGIVLLPGNHESPMNYKDNAYPFKQDSNFLYYGGAAKPRLALVLDVEDGTVTLFGDDFTVDDIVWMGPMPTIKELAEKGGIQNTAPLSKLADMIDGAIQKTGRSIFYLRIGEKLRFGYPGYCTGLWRK